MVSVTINERSEHQPIKSFRLRCHESHDNSMFEYLVSTLLTAATERGVKHLDIHMYDTLKSSVNSCVFCSINLVVLKLKGVSVNHFIPANLPSLRTLHLNRVQFIDDGQIVEILNACPVLEDLEMKDISITFWSDESDEDVKKLTNLIRADLTNVSRYGVYLDVLSNVEFLRLESMRICSSSSLNNQERMEMMKELLALPRISVTCGIYFE
ncbi:FBD-associated F-box protein At5g38590-like [Vicia villosa]|uniref:FBD-associated F-box protein At5g38590-like n=1 Tax=Vicia villosa TaxID=3911 RepID=UPI00273C230F|nr:FBD-associated F-box protein At5g38590-like [Vicia villosa]